MPELPQKLSSEQVDEQLKALPEWGLAGEAIQRTYLFKDFVTSMGFVQQIAQHAERSQHHPDIMIRYGKVTLTLSTHDAGGISEKDFVSARFADEAAAAFPSATKTVVSPEPAKAAKKKK